MKLSLNWIKDFVSLDGISVEEIAKRLSLTTAEVEGWEQKGNAIKGVVVGEILTCMPHPTSKKPLSLLTVTDGKKTVPVVCGATNCRVGMKVAFSPVGAKLGDLEIGIANLAGEESHGMCCSGLELGISSDHDGIIDLPSNCINGTPIEKVLTAMNDIILEIDNKSITNRPDLWGHYGFARELAVIFKKKLKPLPVADIDKYKDLPPVPVKIETDNCYSFGAFKIENIREKVANLNIQTRLFYCGINTHGLLVDLSNYIMLELGQPNHAFDASKVKGLSAGTGKVGDLFTTLKNQEIKITADMTFIKSDGVPVSLAGIMGGANSLICDSTTNVVFEFATFNPYNIRKTSGETGIRSDSSARYEKSLDTNLNKLGAARAIKLISEHDKGAKVVSSFNWVVKKPTVEKTLKLGQEYLERFAGTKFDYKEVEGNLSRLGFQPVITDKDITVTVPTWRATKDISLPVDIIEEITRTIGYDNIKPTAPRIEIAPVTRSESATRERFIKDLLANKYDMTEIHTYIWNDDKVLDDLGIETQSYLRITNSVGENSNIRSEMIPSLLTTLVKSRNRDRCRIFEIGRVFKKDSGENTVLCVQLSSKTKSSAELYKEVAHMLGDIIEKIGGKPEFELGTDTGYIHPKNNARILVGGERAGKLAIIHPEVSERVEKGLGIVSGCVNLSKLEKLVTAKPIKAIKESRFPKTTMDFTFTTDKIYRELDKVYSKFTHPLLVGYRLKDIYRPESGATKYTLEFTATSQERTLTTDDIREFWTKIVDWGNKNHFPVDAE